MKKLVCCLVLLITITGFVFASDSYSRISSMINRKLTDDQIAEIQKLSVDLTSEERTALYSQFECEKGLPFALNIAVGCGIGSFVQGDKTHGTIFLCSELASLTAFSIGYINILKKVIDDPHANISFDTGLAVTGFVAFAGFRIWECIQPFLFAKDYNQKLNYALNGAPELAVVPTTVNGQVVPAVVGTVKF